MKVKNRCREGRWNGVVGSLFTWCCGMACALWGCVAFAQGEDASESVRSVPRDFRPEVLLGFSSVFVLIIIYLILSHRRNSALREDVEFLKSRVQNLD